MRNEETEMTTMKLVSTKYSSGSIHLRVPKSKNRPSAAQIAPEKEKLHNILVDLQKQVLLLGEILEEFSKVH